MAPRPMISMFNLSQKAPSSSVGRMPSTLTTRSATASLIASSPASAPVAPPVAPPVATQVIPQVAPPVVSAPKSARRKHSKVAQPPVVVDDESDDEDVPERPRKRVRGTCRMIKSQSIVIANGSRIKLNYDERFRGAEKSQVHSLLTHDIGGIVRTHCPMDVPSFDDLSKKKKCDLRDFLTVSFDINYDDELTSQYIDSIFKKAFTNWKYDCHLYFQEFEKAEEAQASPPLEFQEADRQVYWRELCEHFMSPEFQKKSAANKGNRGKKKSNHHGGAKLFVYRIDDLLAKGSKFPAVDNYKDVYVTPDNPEAAPLYEKMQEKINEFNNDYASQFAPDTPLHEIPPPDPAIGVKILTETLEEVRPNVGSYVRGMGRGMIRDVKRRFTSSTSQVSSNKVKELEEKLEQSQDEVKGLKEKMESQSSMFSKLVDELIANGLTSLTGIMTQSTSTPNQV